MIVNQHYSKYLFFSAMALLSAIFLVPGSSYAFIIGSFESLKGLHLSSANSLVILGLNHGSGLVLGFGLPPPPSPARYPGLIPVVQIAPLVILVTFVYFGSLKFYQALKPALVGYGVETENMLDAAIGLVFIAMGFIMFNVLLAATDAILSVLGA